MGGLAAVQSFYRLYLVPGMGHGFSNGTANPDANVLLPTRGQLYAALTDWVEKGTAPGTLTARSGATAPTPRSQPLCLYPLKAVYSGGDPDLAASYRCG